MKYVGDTSKYVNGQSGIHAMNGLHGGNLNVADTAARFNSMLDTDTREWLMNRMRADGVQFRGDAISNQSMFFSRALEYLTAATYDVQYEILPFRNILPVINEGGPGIKEIVSEVYDHFGKAQIVNGGAKDIPFVAAGGKEIRYPVVMWAIGAEWNLQELQSFLVAQRNGRGRRSPEQMRQAAALRGIEEALNEQALFGTPDNGIYGLLNNPLVASGSVAAGASTKTEWEAKTPDEILADINSLADSVWTYSKMREMPDKLLLPPSNWSILKNRHLPNREISIMQYLVENSQYFKSVDDIIPINELEGAGVGGTGKMVVYAKKEDKLACEIPQEATALPMQEQLFTYVMAWYAYSAGTIIRYPRSIAYAEGI